VHPNGDHHPRPERGRDDAHRHALASLCSAGWILAHAARRADATTITIAFGNTVTLLAPPRTRPTHVLDMNAIDGTEKFVDAVKLADLRHRTAVRILPVVSDGVLVEGLEAAQKIL
jgi:hypothetical protein